jgi:formylglycine-generating enzyme required for sulfatase activity
VTFEVIAGTSYAIAVDGYEENEGDIALSVAFDGSTTNVPFTEANAPIALWTTTEAWQQGGENLYRHKDAKYFLPSEDEWYKAAYYDPNKGGAGVGGYWDYATGSDSAPTAVASGTGAGTAVYGQTFETGPADITNAGGLSPYGTMAQNGNAFEWCESASTAPNDSAVESRVLRGGAWDGSSLYLQSSYRFVNNPASEGITNGFRVAAVPE